jgi:TolB-like protein/Tfp pilus assembly protein PilF
VASEVHPQSLEIGDSLARIFASKQFSNAERRRKLLAYLVEETLAGRGPDLKEFRIGVDVYGRDAGTYDPRIDAVIRVEVGRLRIKLAEYYAGDGRDDAVRIELPKGSYSVRFQANSGPEADHNAEPAETPRRRNWRPAALGLVTILILIAAIGVWTQQRRTRSRVDSLAVLPFSNLTGDPAFDYFSEGLTDELTATLGRIQRLRVISRASTFQFKNRRETPREIGRELGVEAILQGSVQRSGDQVRVIAQLNSTSDESQIWSAMFDGNGMASLRLEDGIAQAVAVRLGDSWVPSRAARDPEVHDLYLRAHFLQVQQTPTALLQAIDLYRQALARDPGDPECNVALASTELYLANLGEKPPHEADRSARQRVQKALEADPSYGEAHSLLAHLLYLSDHNWPAADAEFKKAVSLSPSSPNVRNNYGYFLTYRGQFDEAQVQFTRGREIDPLNVIPHFNMGSLYAFKRDYSRAEAELRIVVETSPKIFIAHILLAEVLTYEKRFDAAYEELDRARALEVQPDMALMFRAIFLARQGRRDEARVLLAKLPISPGTYYPRAIAYMELGERDAAFRYLEQAYQAHEGNLITLPVNQTFAEAHSDPRFADLLRRMGAL